MRRSFRSGKLDVPASDGAEKSTKSGRLAMVQNWKIRGVEVKKLRCHEGTGKREEGN